MKRAAEDQQPASGVERVLSPVVAAALFVAALVASSRDRREQDVAHTPPDDAPPVPRWRERLERIPVVRTIVRVQLRYGEIKGGNLASAVAFQSFLSLFPLLLVAVALLGFVAARDVDVAGRLAANLGLTGAGAQVLGDAIHQAATNRKAAAPLGLAGLAWSGMGLVAAFQYLVDQAWQVEDRGLKDKARGALWIIGALTLFVGAAGITTVLNWLPGYAAPIGVAMGIAVNFALWTWTFKVLPNRKLPWRAVMPGAVLGAIGMEFLKVAGAIYVPRAVANASALYGTLGVVLAVLGWLLVFSRLVAYAVVLNVVLWERDHGTVRTTIEVPAGTGIDRTDNVTRGGRVERSDAAA